VTHDDGARGMVTKFIADLDALCLKEIFKE
jgi:hypothetical protein